jgi:hypothetical protein
MESVKVNQQKNKEKKEEVKKTNKYLKWLKDRWLKH